MGFLRSTIAAAVISAAFVSEPQAATTGDWPCVQRKVAEISLAAIWSGPQPDGAALKWRDDASIANLVPSLAARRTSEKEISQAIAELATSSGEAKNSKLLALLTGLFETINSERAEVIAGLERFGDGQKQLAIVIRDENTKLSALRNEVQADPARLSEQSERLVWNLRIFDERQKSLRFVCEVPVLLEQRLFAISKNIQKALQGSN
jgi:hypothetical protein